MQLVWIALIGLLAGIVARLITPGRKAPFGFILTAVVGVTGAFALAYLGQAGGWYRVEDPAGLIAAAAGAGLALAVWALAFKSARATSSV